VKRAIIIGIVGLLLIAIAIGLSLLQRPSEPDLVATAPAAPSAPTGAVAPVTPPPPMAPAASVAPTVPVVASEPSAAAAEGVPPAAASQSAPVATEQPVAPSFDVVRVDEKGDAVIAGRAAPNSEVVVRDGQTAIGAVTTDSRGEFVFLPEKPLAPGQRVLSLESTDPATGAAVVSQDEVVLAVPEKGKTIAGMAAATGDTTPLAVLVPRDGSGARPLQVPEPPPMAAAPTASDAPTASNAPATSDAPAAVAAVVPDEPAPSTTAAPVVADAQPTAPAPSAPPKAAAPAPVTVPPQVAAAPEAAAPASTPAPMAGGTVQAPSTLPSSPVPPVAMAAPSLPEIVPPKANGNQAIARDGGPVSVDVVDYDEIGNVTVGGQAQPGAQVQVYVNNGFVGRVIVAGTGRWSLTPTANISPGRYLLRVDQLAPSGMVIARAELPFTRANVTEIAASDNRAVVVQPGNSLWRIARRVYGKGLMYSDIYRANREQIRNPNLIYPGQIFAVPADGEKAG
jgi:nucleoid-associated protein YgaU